MANTQSTFGFQFYGYLPGYAVDQQYSVRQIQSSYASAIWFGDPVIKSAASPYIQVGLGTGNLTAMAGIFYGCTYVPSAGGAPVWSPWFPGSVKTDATAYLISAPGAMFKVAALLTAVPTTAVGDNIGWSTGAGGTSVGQGFSTFTVDQGTLTTGPSAPFTIVKMYDGVGNGADTTTSYNWVIVAFNNQFLRAGATAVA
jgi:hypothetical protein